jgi:hypothetical protein
MNFIKFLRPIALASTSILLLNLSAANAAIIFSENFEAATAGSNITTANTEFKTTASATAPNSIFAVTDNGTFFGNSNQFLRFDDSSAAVGPPTVRRSFTTAPVIAALTSGSFQFSFDFYDEPNATPTGFVNTSLRLYLSNGSGATAANRAVDLQIYQDPDNTFNNVGVSALSNAGNTQAPSVAAPYSQNTKYHIDVVGSLDVAGHTYANGSESVAFQTFDLWLDGNRIADNVAFRNNITQINDITITGGSTTANRVVTMNLDNIVLFSNEITVIPEPSICIAAGLSLIGLVAMRRKK